MRLQSANNYTGGAGGATARRSAACLALRRAGLPRHRRGRRRVSRGTPPPERRRDQLPIVRQRRGVDHRRPALRRGFDTYVSGCPAKPVMVPPSRLRARPDRGQRDPGGRTGRGRRRHPFRVTAEASGRAATRHVSGGGGAVYNNGSNYTRPPPARPGMRVRRSSSGSCRRHFSRGMKISTVQASAAESRGRRARSPQVPLAPVAECMNSRRCPPGVPIRLRDRAPGTVNTRKRGRKHKTSSPPVPPS
jgi:hypothetical protein